MHHHYLVKAALILVLIVGLNIFLKVNIVLPVPRLRRVPIWLLGVIDIIEMYGWMPILAMIVAAIWQIAERHG